MLVIQIPTGELNGKCKVNGEHCEFRIDVANRELAIRTEGETEWDARRILQANAMGDMTGYVCENSAAQKAEMAAELAKDGH